MQPFKFYLHEFLTCGSTTLATAQMSTFRMKTPPGGFIRVAEFVRAQRNSKLTLAKAAAQLIFAVSFVLCY
jgi:hypothetical protein